MENLKIEKGKTYTYEELKEIFKNAMGETIHKPFGDIKDEKLKKESEDPHFQFSTMLSGIVILHTMENNMFAKEDNKDE
ncbi:MAG: hypothetical protein IJV31_02800 [Clostridia bacterium]|nr:hypothetical protein [Clostridia bacterium]